MVYFVSCYSLYSVNFFCLDSKPKSIQIRPLQDADKQKLVLEKLQTFGKAMLAADIVHNCLYPLFLTNFQ